MRKSRTASKTVRVNAADLPIPTPADLRRLKKAQAGPIDLSEMPPITDAQFRQAKAERASRLAATRRGKVA